MSAKQDKTFTRTATDLERKYDLGKSFSEVREGIKVVNATAQEAKRTAVNAETEAKAARSEVLQLSDSITLTVEDGEPGHTAMIKLKVGDKEITGQIDLQGCVTFTNLRTSGATEINGDNIKTGRIMADLITAGTLKSVDGLTKIDLDSGRAEFFSNLIANGLRVRSKSTDSVDLVHIFGYESGDGVITGNMDIRNGSGETVVSVQAQEDGALLHLNAPDNAYSILMSADLTSGASIHLLKGGGGKCVAEIDTEGSVNIFVDKINGKAARWVYNTTIGHYILVSDDV